MLTTEARSYIDASVPVLRDHGNTITKVFYQNLFSAHPELKNIFNMGNQAIGAQQQSLAAAVFAYASNIDNLAALEPVVKRIAHKHASLGIKPDQYPIVGRHLLGAIKEVLGEAATEPLLDAWGAAYGLLADTLITAERSLTAGSGRELGKLLKVRVSGIEEQSEFVKSYRLSPIDAARPGFAPGQYISVRIHLEDGTTQLRQYSLSDSTEKPYLRISVKREERDGSPKGRVSNWIHEHVSEGDILEISQPYGDFMPDIEGDFPIALISAGVGITPMISVLNELLDKNPDRQVIFAHQARNRTQHSHINDILYATQRMPNLKRITYYKTPETLDLLSKTARHGVLKAEHLDIEPGTRCYLCGPSAFMKTMIQDLVELGVPRMHIHREVFGPDLFD